MRSTRPPVLVAVPARNEAATLGACLTSVLVALRRARRLERVGRAVVAVCAHRCADGTADIARGALAAADGVEGLVVEEPREMAVGAVRWHLIERACAGWSEAALQAGWLFSTDADTAVPPGWFDTTLDAARRERAAAVAGLVDLVDWRADAAARRAYDQLVRAGLTEHGHRHVYAANLAVRLSAYFEAGGFPLTGHGEEHALIAALKLRGYAIATPRHPRARTSGRMPGRAAHGLGTLLGEIARSAAPVEKAPGDTGAAEAVGA